MRRKSIKHYLAAKRYEPNYLNRGYWVRELAGMFFLEKRYSASARLYELCLQTEQFSNEPLTFALAADAHFMARHLSRSFELFQQYTDMVQTPDSEFILKKQTIKTIADTTNIEGPFSPSKATELYNTILEMGKLGDKKKINQCLIYDPICPQACFQMAILLKNEKLFDKACIFFLISALVAEWNVAAWLNSFFMAVGTSSHMMPIILSVAYKKCGYQLIKVLREEVLDKIEMPIEMKTQTVEALRALFEKYEDDKKESGF